MENKLTKREILAMIADRCSDDATIVDYCNTEIDSLDRKADKARERAAAKKVAGDELRGRIQGVMSHTEFMTAQDIVDALGEEEVTTQKVINRVSQLIKLEIAEKTDLTVEPTEEGEKKRTVKAYKLV